MEAALSAAARALSRGDALDAIKWIGERRSPIARAMLGTALAQMGDYDKARAHLRAALRGLGTEERLQRARCLAADAEVAMARGDLRWNAAAVTRSIDELEQAGDSRNAFYMRLVAARAALRLGAPRDAEAYLAVQALDRAPPLHRAFVALARAEVAATRGDEVALDAALARAEGAAREASIAPLSEEVASASRRFEAPCALVGYGGVYEPANLRRLFAVEREARVVFDVGRREVRAAAAVVSFARKSVLFDLACVLAEHASHEIARDEIIALAFGARRSNDSLRSRLRVEVGRVRKLLSPLALRIEPTAHGYTMRCAAVPAVVKPLEDSPQARLLALLHDGIAWSSSSLAVALGQSERTVLRALASLEIAQKVARIGRGRGQKWVRLARIPTHLLLPRQQSRS